MMSISIHLLLAAAICYVKIVYDGLPSEKLVAQPPVANTKNGPFSGIYSEAFRQDFFLGIPYAQPPVGSRRFQPPLGVNGSWDEPWNVTEYGPACIGYGPESNGVRMSEDCLTLNIIRPHLDGKRTQPLPVAVWIHGGGFFTGSSSLEGYNLSRLVQTSVQAGQPIIGVSFNYRLSAFGWLWSDDVERNQGTANVGFHDQRLALHWIRDNIAAFGGHPDKVVLFGESAGAQSVGMHLLAYGGRDDRLFRGAIMQSGSCLQRWPIWVSNPRHYREEVYRNLTDATGCTHVTSPYQCLIKLPFEELNSALNVSNTWMSGTGLGPFVVTYDGQVIQDYPSTLIQQGRFVKVPIIYGTNTDEGTVNGRYSVDNDDAFRAVLAESGLNQTSIMIYEALYPNIDKVGIPAHYQRDVERSQGGADSLTSPGGQWKRVSAWYGDISQHAPRRAMAQAWEQHGVPAYSYRFDIMPAHVPPFLGATHAVEIPFVFGNVDGLGHKVNPFGARDDPRHGAYLDASKLMTRMWISFIHELTPNRHGLSRYPEWLSYSPKGIGYGQNFVFAIDDSRLVFSPYVEDDEWRIPGIEFARGHSIEHWSR